LVIVLASAWGPACRREAPRPTGDVAPPGDTAAAGDVEPATAAPATPVVVYCSVDEEFSRLVFARFEKETGVAAEVVYDSEAGKTTGLVRKIEQEASRPRADVFWSSELFNTILLARQGLLEPYDPPAAADIPARYRDAQHRWTAFGLRARVLGFEPSRLPADQVPGRWEDLARPEIAPRLALANPLFGTTRGHVAAMFALWGPERGRAWLTQVRDGKVLVVDGNTAAVRAIMDGRVDLAATDTDDVWVAQRSGSGMDLRYPDMGDGGTLLIPASVGIVKGCRHPEAARRLVDFLVSAEVERLLGESTYRSIPVRAELRMELGLELPPETSLSFDAVADAMDEAVAATRDILLR